MSAYTEWAASVVKNGGVVKGFPARDTQGRERVSGAFPVEVWGPKANAKVWPIPDKMVSNPDGTKKVEYAPGKLTATVGYYLAPSAVQLEYQQQRVATASETAKASEQLLDKWGVPQLLRSPLSLIATIVVVVGAVFLVANRRR